MASRCRLLCRPTSRLAGLVAPLTVVGPRCRCRSVFCCGPCPALASLPWPAPWLPPLWPRSCPLLIGRAPAPPLALPLVALPRIGYSLVVCSRSLLAGRAPWPLAFCGRALGCLLAALSWPLRLWPPLRLLWLALFALASARSPLAVIWPRRWAPVVAIVPLYRRRHTIWGLDTPRSETKPSQIKQKHSLFFPTSGSFGSKSKASQGELRGIVPPPRHPAAKTRGCWGIPSWLVLDWSPTCVPWTVAGAFCVVLLGFPAPSFGPLRVCPVVSCPFLSIRHYYNAQYLEV